MAEKHHMPLLCKIGLVANQSFAITYTHQSPFGKSDHSVLIFQFKCYTEILKDRSTRQNFIKADYENIKKQLNNIKWKEQLEGKTANKQWDLFQRKNKIFSINMSQKRPQKLRGKNKVYYIIKKYLQKLGENTV